MKTTTADATDEGRVSILFSLSPFPLFRKKKGKHKSVSPSLSRPRTLKHLSQQRTAVLSLSLSFSPSPSLSVACAYCSAPSRATQQLRPSLSLRFFDRLLVVVIEKSFSENDGSSHGPALGGQVVSVFVRQMPLCSSSPCQRAEEEEK